MKRTVLLFVFIALFVCSLFIWFRTTADYSAANDRPEKTSTSENPGTAGPQMFKLKHDEINDDATARAQRTREVMTFSETLSNRQFSAANVVDERKLIEKSDMELFNEAVTPTGSSEDDFNTMMIAHSRLVTEPRDEKWAKLAEQQLRNYISTAMGPERVNIVALSCASTICEIQATGRDPSNDQSDVQDWQKYIFNMANQPWWNEYQFNQPHDSVMLTPDKRAMFIVFVTRTNLQ